jgi:hypothetical protein
MSANGGVWPNGKLPSRTIVQRAQTTLLQSRYTGRRRRETLQTSFVRARSTPSGGAA